MMICNLHWIIVFDQINLLLIENNVWVVSSKNLLIL